METTGTPQGDRAVGRSSGYGKTSGRRTRLFLDYDAELRRVGPGMVTPGSEDRDGVMRLLAALRARFSTIELVWADGGYAGRLLGWAKSVLALAVEIVKRTDDVEGFKVLPRRWVVERTFAWICRHRRCVRDYETRPDHHEAMVYIAMIVTMSRRLARTT